MLTTNQVAETLNISQRRVQALITSGRLTATRVGHAYVIQARDLKAFTPRKAGRPSKA